MVKSNKRGTPKKEYPTTLSLFELARQEIDGLEKRIAQECPKRGYTPPLHQQVSFTSLPLSQCTLRGLDDGGFTEMTAIQHACIPHALAGRDILGAAKTGSGKTLAFLVPLLEKLYKSQCFTPHDYEAGLGAIVLSPTRELALQTFQVLRKIGAYHAMTAGLLVGGKKEFQMEQRHVGRTNIVIATPGRLLQHLEQTTYLDASMLQVLVLDEADRILDMGFREQMTRILDYLPTAPERQTMLFSATQTKKVGDLATLSLSKPEYLGVHDKTQYKTPTSLQQSVVVVPLEHKLNAVYSFIKSHLKKKTIIFVASCSQVRHAWELFCALQPGLPVMALHGKLAQEKRNKIYSNFLNKSNAVLFATDVASRGLDFPNVDWVVQMDAPEDIEMYIHRAGRTARYKSNGKALLMLTPSEDNGFTQKLQENKIPIKKLSINPTKTVLVTQKAAALVAQRPQLNELAKKAFSSYLRSIHLMPDKDIFTTEGLPLEEYATSLGLGAAPKVRFLKQIVDREEQRKKKNVNHKLHRLKEQIKAEKLAKRIAKLGDKKAIAQTAPKETTAEEEDDMLVVKRKHDFDDDDDDDDDDDALPLSSGIHEVTSSRNPKKIRVDGGTGQNTRIKFDDNGEVEDTHIIENASKNKAVERHSLEASHEEYMQKVKARLADTAETDRAEAKARIREKHRKKRFQGRGERDDGDDNDEEVVVTLGNDGDDSDSGSGNDDDSDSGSGDDDDSDSIDVAKQEELALAMIRGD